MLPQRLLGLLDGSPPDPRPDDRLVRVAADVDAMTPRRFLRHGQAPRWFFEHGGSWVAGIGAAARRSLGPDDGAGRYEAVRAHLRELDERCLHADEEAPRLRMLGGFAFHEAPDDAPPWSPFGTACFGVPAIALHHGPEGPRLVGTARVREDAEPEAAVERAREALDKARTVIDTPAKRPREYQVPRPSASTEPEVWEAAVEEALADIRRDRFRKVVLARALELDAPSQPDPAVVLSNLRHRNPGTNLFLVEPAPGKAFLGAAPEVLASVRGRTFKANAVAGSIERGDDEAEDERLARRLASSEKDRREHEIVVDAMRRRLARVVDHVQVGRDTGVLRLATIQHLERELYARLAPDQDALDLVEALHPTPAVCGDPREAARAFLREREPFERGWYAGPVGWIDADGDGTFAPALRSTLLDDDTWHLFAGAGIVEASQPRREWRETRTKFRPVLDALGVRELPTEASP